MGERVGLVDQPGSSQRLGVELWALLNEDRITLIAFGNVTQPSAVSRIYQYLNARSVVITKRQGIHCSGRSGELRQQ
jgi:hypothetical protein